MIFEAIVLGVIQGLTEFLPISSSGHLILAQWATGWQGELMNNLTFDVSLHAGTLAALLWYFRGDWFRFVKAAVRTLRGAAAEHEARLAAYIAIATLPAVVAGLLFNHAIETAFRSPQLVSATLIGGATVMWLADRYSSRQRQLGAMTLGHALFVGFAQAIALIPGVSRSGITISAALAAGYRREDAARFSFLLATPVIAGAAVYQLKDVSLSGDAAAGFALGTLSSAVVGYLAIRFLIAYLQRHSLNLFVWYRVAVAVAALALWYARGAQ